MLRGARRFDCGRAICWIRISPLCSVRNSRRKGDRKEHWITIRIICPTIRVQFDSMIAISRKSAMQSQLWTGQHACRFPFFPPASQSLSNLPYYPRSIRLDDRHFAQERDAESALGWPASTLADSRSSLQLSQSLSALSLCSHATNK